MKLQLTIFSIICTGFLGGCQLNTEITHNAIMKSNDNITLYKSFYKNNNLEQLLLNNQQLLFAGGYHNNSFRERSVALGVR